MGYGIHNKLLNQFCFDLRRDTVVGFLSLTLVYPGAKQKLTSSALLKLPSLGTGFETADDG